MNLPPEVISYLNDNAAAQGAAAPGPEDDLFKFGVLDSFTLVDFVTLLEGQCGISVPDADVRPENFQTVGAVGRYVEARRRGGAG